MGAHDVPSGATATDYVESILSEQLPQSSTRALLGLRTSFANPGGSRLSRARTCSCIANANLDLRMHVDEFVDGGGGDLAAALGVTTADHAYHTSMETRHPDELGRRQRWVPARYTVRHGRPMARHGRDC